jgi:hypothetical protein
MSSFHWPLAEAAWISPETVATAKASMSAVRFAAEYLGIPGSAADAMFPRTVLDGATAPIRGPGWPLPAGTGGLLGGCDWGATIDRSAVSALGRLQRPFGAWVVVCAHAWRSGHPLTGPGSVMEDLVSCPARFDRVAAESNGLGWPLAAELRRRRRGGVVEMVTTTLELKASAYSALRQAMETGRLVIPASCEELLRELLLLRVTLLPHGGERIEAGAGHDDVADSLMLAAGPYKSGETWRTRLGDALQREPLDPFPDDWATGTDTVQTGAGLSVPAVAVLEALRAAAGARGGHGTVFSGMSADGSQRPVPFAPGDDAEKRARIRAARRRHRDWSDAR